MRSQFAVTAVGLADPLPDPSLLDKHARPRRWTSREAGAPDGRASPIHAPAQFRLIFFESCGLASAGRGLVASLMLENALARLDGALAQLEAAARRRIEAERGRANLETELTLMQDDRARLAAELDGAVARLGQIESAALDVDQRLERAITVVGAVISRNQPDIPAEH